MFFGHQNAFILQGLEFPFELNAGANFPELVSALFVVDAAAGFKLTEETTLDSLLAIQGLRQKRIQRIGLCLRLLETHSRRPLDECRLQRLSSQLGVFQFQLLLLLQNQIHFARHDAARGRL